MSFPSGELCVDLLVWRNAMSGNGGSLELEKGDKLDDMDAGEFHLYFGGVENPENFQLVVGDVPAILLPSFAVPK